MFSSLKENEWSLYIFSGHVERNLIKLFEYNKEEKYSHVDISGHVINIQR